MDFEDTLYNTIDAYLSGSLSATEQQAFEQEITQNPEIKKEIELYQSLQQHLRGDWTRLDPALHTEELKNLSAYRRSNEFVDIKQHLEQVGTTYFEQPTPTTKRRWWYYAAAIAVLVIGMVSVQMFTTPTTDALYAEYATWKELPSLTVQGDDATTVAQGEALFYKKQYREAIRIFETAQTTDTYPTIWMYLGASYLEMGNTEKAIALFQQLKDSNTLDSPKANWYLALAYLKTGNNEQSKQALQQLISTKNNFKQAEAIQLLDALE